MLTLVVFGLAIVSSFAMETDPPTEPVKTTVEAEVVINDLEQPPVLEEGYGYKDALGNCNFLAAGAPGPDCSYMNSGDICTEKIGSTDYDLVLFTRVSPLHPWICTNTEIRKKL